MVKECEVLINNDLVTVIKFDDTEVQVPAIKRDAETVKVVFENNSYKVVDDDYKEKPVKVEEHKAEKQTKKTIAKETEIAQIEVEQADE